MHVCVSGLAILFCLTQVEFDESILQLQLFQRKRQAPMDDQIVQVASSPGRFASSSKRARL